MIARTAKLLVFVSSNQANGLLNRKKKTVLLRLWESNLTIEFQLQPKANRISKKIAKKIFVVHKKPGIKRTRENAQ